MPVGHVGYCLHLPFSQTVQRYTCKMLTQLDTANLLVFHCVQSMSNGLIQTVFYSIFTFVNLVLLFSASLSP